MAKYGWAMDAKPPRPWTYWSEFVHDRAHDVAMTGQEIAQESRTVAEDDVVFGRPARTAHFEGLRPVSYRALHRAARASVRSYLEERLMLDAIDWRAAAETVFSRAIELLERRGFVVSREDND